MLTSPVAAARAAVATGAWGKSKHDKTRHVSDTWKCGSLSFIITHPPEDKKQKNKKKHRHSCSSHNMFTLFPTRCEHYLEKTEKKSSLDKTKNGKGKVEKQNKNV